MHPLLSDPQRRVAGTRQIIRAASQGKLEIAYLAKDAQEHIRVRILTACADAGVPVEEIPSMAALGESFGIAVGAAAAGLLKQA